MKRVWVSMAVLGFMILSCTKEKTHYEADIDEELPVNQGFMMVQTGQTGPYTVSVEAPNGILCQGYNPIRLKFTNSQTGENVKPTAVTFLPVLTDEQGVQQAAPHHYSTEYKQPEGYFSDYAVLWEPDHPGISWQLYIRFTTDRGTYTLRQAVAVHEQPNSNLNMSTFVAQDGEHYIIALVAPTNPRVGENELVAGIYQRNIPATIPKPGDDFPSGLACAYTAVVGYTLQLDPRMPEPAMGNHSSPNNKDLTQQDDGLYHGIVHYTMTGNWTLNFRLLNAQGQLVKGNQVPHDFTPGVPGSKSALHIDIIF